jgi:hypothetical protein
MMNTVIALKSQDYKGYNKLVENMASALLDGIDGQRGDDIVVSKEILRDGKFGYSRDMDAFDYSLVKAMEALGGDLSYDKLYFVGAAGQALEAYGQLLSNNGLLDFMYNDRHSVHLRIVSDKVLSGSFKAFRNGVSIVAPKSELARMRFANPLAGRGRGFDWIECDLFPTDSKDEMLASARNFVDKNSSAEHPAAADMSAANFKSVYFVGGSQESSRQGEYMENSPAVFEAEADKIAASARGDVLVVINPRGYMDRRNGGADAASADALRNRLFKKLPAGASAYVAGKRIAKDGPVDAVYSRVGGREECHDLGGGFAYHFAIDTAVSKGAVCTFTSDQSMSPYDYFTMGGRADLLRSSDWPISLPGQRRIMKSAISKISKGRELKRADYALLNAIDPDLGGAHGRGR